MFSMLKETVVCFPSARKYLCLIRFICASTVHDCSNGTNSLGGLNGGWRTESPLGWETVKDWQYFFERRGSQKAKDDSRWVHTLNKCVGTATPVSPIIGNCSIFQGTALYLASGGRGTLSQGNQSGPLMVYTSDSAIGSCQRRAQTLHKSCHKAN